MSSHKKKGRMRLRSHGSRTPSVASVSSQAADESPPLNDNEEIQSLQDAITSMQGTLGALQLRISKLQMQKGRAPPSGGASQDASPRSVTTKTAPARNSDPGPVTNGLPNKVWQQLYWSAKPTEEEPTVWLQRLFYTLRQYNVERMNYPREFSLCLKDDAFVWGMKFWEDNKDTLDPKERLPPDVLGRTLISGLHHSHATNISSHVLYDTSYEHVMKLLHNLATTIGEKGHRPYVDRSNTGNRPQHGDRPQLRLRAPQESALAQAARAYMARWSEAADDPDPDNLAPINEPEDSDPATLALDDGPGYIHKFGPNRILSPSILCML
mmetsp:Transcript_7116/g.16290  ORF Transcript_7116/g.16290 Transcript_7116/m.16290 type:complete len:325 (+) Transcript_7116:175-1149(+)|eukprot:CAMPEP_0171996954 /NCGR_PEP_ID=MMETSP1041-20130122/424_1 /TAXON_ID=464988 /ORGANISM="Hemiselmis andersenii, Strain CCMP439" /LENGTH=324 /DNA_ID=CAMNT_0012650187 /DNA_START=81 /DNA_END=1055 /DNA_ORIENTATION=+